MRTAEWGYGLLGLAGFTWIGTGIAYEIEPIVLLGWLVLGVGFFLAAASGLGRLDPHWGRISLGHALAFVGTMPFFLVGFVIGGLQPDLSMFAMLLYLAGIATGLVFAGLRWRDRPAPRVVLLTAMGLVLAASLMWLPLDGIDDWYWQPGNLLTVAGSALVLVGARNAPAA